MIKPRNATSLAVLLYLLVLLGFGLVRYPDAPLEPCLTSSFCGKQGQPHTEQEYRQFLTWQALLEWTWIPGVLVLFFLNRARIRRRRASRQP
jgi:hypothetical protein